MNNSRKIVFFGSPIQSSIILNSLVENGHEIVGVITQQDKRRSRGNTLYPTAVKSVALDLGIEVFEPVKKSDIENVVKELVETKGAQVGVVVAYGKILTPEVLNAFKYGCFNVHYSLLPRWRGAAPVERAILEGDTKTGISIMSMDEGLDTGPVYKMEEIQITSTTTSLDLYEQMAQQAKIAINDVLNDIGNIESSEQVGDATYAKKLDKNDFEIVPSDNLDTVSRKVRAGTLIKGALVNTSVGKLRIHEVAQVSQGSHDNDNLLINKQGEILSKDGSLQILTIQSENKPAMDFSSWVNGIDKTKFDIEVV